MLVVLERKVQGNGGEGLLRSGIVSAAIKLSSLVLRFGVALLLARILGAREFGIYAYVFALVSLLAVPVQFGFTALVVRETAKAHAVGRWSLMLGLWRWTSRVCILMALVVGGIAGTIAVLFSDRFTASELTTFALGLLFLPLSVLGDLRGAALRGLRRVIEGQLPEFVIRPAVFVLFVVVLGFVSYVFDAEQSLTAVNAMAVQVLSAAVALFVGVWLLRRAQPAELAGHSPEYDRRSWLLATLPLAFLNGMSFVNQYTDTLMLGALGTVEDVGIYRLVAQCATCVVIGLQAINVVVAPRFARAYALHDIGGLKSTYSFTSRISLLAGVPIALAFAIWGKEILGIAFGEDFAVGHTALAILCFGQLFHAGVGSSAALLNMTGHERYTARAVVFAACINVSLNALLIPRYGVNGAAVASAASVVGLNGLLWTVARTRVLRTTALTAADSRAKQAAS